MSERLESGPVARVAKSAVEQFASDEFAESAAGFIELVAYGRNLRLARANHAAAEGIER